MKALIFLSFSLLSSHAEDVDMSIVVSDVRSSEVYVAPIKVIDMSQDADVDIDVNSVFGLASMHSRLAKGVNPINVYNRDTISYIWEGCDYTLNAKQCTYDNGHYLLETTITLSDNQFTIEMLLYNNMLQVISRGSWSDASTIRWIKQQQMTAYHDYRNNTIIDRPKEELPLKWVIPKQLLQKHLYQASLGLWVGAKLN
ncbi:MAG: hypothetical protein CME70_19015 [Halobacteriovorax sp.]|nr:hypothetical protein [Halobacteriovorax sp.]|tara:strand:- start:537 stop:1133 length:597 start_codon:yes stop_codon:yes gene_type:complete